MKKFIIEEEFWSIFPNSKIGIITAYGLNNKVIEQEKFRALLDENAKIALTYLTNSEFSSNPVIKVWRDAFQKFKTKKGVRASIEALLKRIHKGDSLPCINPLVDIYNSISLKYALPCGGEDIDTFVGNIRLTKATGSENFITLGSNENEPPYPEEIIYKDDAGAICRCWNWRESVRTMLTEDTKNAFLCIELVDQNRLKDLENALEELKRIIQENLGGDLKISILDINKREISL
ncbi:MAG: B3/4 domain-containing protein [Fusobacterium sp.]|nr:B3/4 domain-containing protein [Fusobacterium sp.]